jgi:DNA-binding response OmpR family regulator
MKGKVAIIGLHDSIVGTLQITFVEAGYQVATAVAGEEGLALCRHFLPQVVLVDTDLPDIDGYQFCRRLRATTRTSHVHIILMASTLDRESRIQGLETGADDFIVIPFDPDEVSLRVRNALRRAAADNLTDPVTGLPSGRLIQTRLRDLVGDEGDWALLRLAVRSLSAFEASHGFLAAQEVLNLVALVLSEVVEQLGSPDDFLGHSGGGRFVIVTTGSRVHLLTEQLTSRIQEVIHTHHTPQEREQGYMAVLEGDEESRLPLMKLDIRCLLATDGPFYDIRSLTEELG